MRGSATRVSWPKLPAGVALITCVAVAALPVSYTTFSGVQTGSGRLTCTLAGQPYVDTPFAGETIVNGQISGSQITFRLGTLTGQNTATVTGTSMTGIRSASHTLRM